MLWFLILKTQAGEPAITSFTDLRIRASISSTLSPNTFSSRTNTNTHYPAANTSFVILDFSTPVTPFPSAYWSPRRIPHKTRQTRRTTSSTASSSSVEHVNVPLYLRRASSTSSREHPHASQKPKLQHPRAINRTASNHMALRFAPNQSRAGPGQLLADMHGEGNQQ